MKGFFQRLLIVDLTNKSFEVEHIEEKILGRYLGGKGLATHLLLRYNPPEVDPFDPENNVIFAPGPLSDSRLYGSCRYGVYTKSPLTGFYGESYSGGSLAIPMSRTGYDAIIIRGKSTNPVWIEISDKTVIFNDASDLWGMDTYTAEDSIKKRVGDDKSGVMVIGPAGENLVRFAVIENDYWRSAGRTGMGAVLGSKKVKGIAFNGNQNRSFADPEDVKNYARNTLNELKDHPAVQAYRNDGTPMMVALMNNAGAFPTRYWSKGKLNTWAKISADVLKDQFHARPRSCHACFMGCGKYIEIEEGKYKGLKLEGPEYETIYAFGGLCLIDSLEEIAHFNDICDRLGMDTISAGNMVAFAIEASNRGKIKETLEYGNASHIAELLQKISNRNGLGDLLADGIKKAAKEWDLEDIAVHVKGLEPAGYDPRILKGMGLAYAVSDRGACHLRSTFYKAELGGLIDPDLIEGKAELFLDFEDRCTLFDCLILCRFYRDFYPWEELSKMIALTTGIELDIPQLEIIASNVTNNTRRFNIREGLVKSDDQLPVRFYNEALEGGNKITAKEIETLVRDYYRLRDWSNEGIPPESS